MERRDWLLVLLLAVREAPGDPDFASLQESMAMLARSGDVPPEQIYDSGPGDDLATDIERLVTDGLARQVSRDARPPGLRATEIGLERAVQLVNEARDVSPAAVQLLYAAQRDGLGSLLPAAEPAQPKPPLKSLVRASRRLAGRLVFERGLETAEIAVDAHHFHPERVRYRPIEWMLLKRTLDTLPIEPDDVLVDFGSGKGRVVVQAARYPCGRVLGVEISPDLNRIARANLERKRHKLRCPVDLITSDMVEFEVPDDMTIAFFFLPVTGELFRKVLENIVESLDRCPRRVKLAHIYPLNHPGGAESETAILATGRFEPTPETRRHALDERGERAAIYVSEAGGSG